MKALQSFQLAGITHSKVSHNRIPKFSATHLREPQIHTFMSTISGNKQQQTTESQKRESYNQWTPVVSWFVP